jgi:hypothetical protein
MILLKRDGANWSGVSSLGWAEKKMGTDEMAKILMHMTQALN